MVERNETSMPNKKIASPTLALESLCLTIVIDAKDERDAATLDFPNASMQTNIGDEHVLMKLRGAVAELIFRVVPETCSDYATYENGKPISHAELIKSLHGILKSALKFYIKVVEDLK